MNPQLLSLIVAVGIGFVAFTIVRAVFKAISLGLKFVLLFVIALIAYLLLRDQIAALVGGG
ncbi:MAG: hypothetical protein ACRDGG_02655 [Anaerolineae bacterium]